MKDLFAPLDKEAQKILESIPRLIDKTFPLPARFRGGLATDVAELSRLLTGGRGERELAYLNRPNILSAYLRYFLPWNIFRLCRLLPRLELSLSSGDSIMDLGCGPLTFTAALWISRPELRALSLEFYCIDRSSQVIEAGKKFFSALVGPDCLWKIVTIKASIGPRGWDFKGSSKLTAAGKKSASLVCAVNVFNEIYEGVHGVTADGKKSVVHSAHLLDSLADSSGCILVVEPGVPRSGEFISNLRNALIDRQRFPLSPCPHCGICPVPGGSSRTGKNRWCHFAFDTEDAPAALGKLSTDAGIPKERAVLSFLFTGPKTKTSSLIQSQRETKGSYVSARIISDAFQMPGGKFGRYGCSERGLVLVLGNRQAAESCYSGSLVNVVVKKPEQRDVKSGALIVEVVDSLETTGEADN